MRRLKGETMQKCKLGNSNLEVPAVELAEAADTAIRGYKR